MKGAFVQVKDLIDSQFPGTEVLGSGYPVPLPQALLARAVLFLQIGISLLAFGGDGIFRALNMPPPAIYLQYRDKKTGVVLGAWIIGNMIQNALTQTGAFEIYSAGELIFSKLQENRMPRVEELISELQRTLQPGN